MVLLQYGHHSEYPFPYGNVTYSRSTISLHDFYKGYQIWNAEASSNITVKRNTPIFDYKKHRQF